MAGSAGGRQHRCRAGGGAFFPGDSSVIRRAPGECRSTKEALLSQTLTNTSLTFAPHAEQKHQLHLHRPKPEGTAAGENSNSPLCCPRMVKRSTKAAFVIGAHSSHCCPLKVSPRNAHHLLGWGKMEDKVSHLFYRHVRLQIRLKVMFAKQQRLTSTFSPARNQNS